jgi:hypothetical protein
VTDPVGLGYSCPLLDCAGVWDGPVLVAARTNSGTSNWAHSVHPGSSHANLQIHNRSVLCVAHFTTLPERRLRRRVNDFPQCSYKLLQYKQKTYTDIIFQHSPLTFQLFWSIVTQTSLCPQKRFSAEKHETYTLPPSLLGLR